MRKFTLFLIFLLSTISCTNLDYIWEELREHEERIEKLETECQRLNSNIQALHTILTALQQNDYITGLVKIMEDGVEVGYSISFAKSGTITIYHGTDGSDGTVPKISVKKASDGEYYWTSDGEWITDEEGDKIPAALSDNGDGQWCTPQFIVVEGEWFISYDNGTTWRSIDKPDVEEGCAIFIDVIKEDGYYIFLLTDGTTLKIPEYNQSQFAGKIISIMGDSISTFRGSIPDGNATWYPKNEVNSPDKTWWSLLLGMTGAELGINNSWSGSRVSNTSETNSGNLGPDRCMPALAGIESLDDNGTPDIILFFGGPNDINNGVPLGTFDKNVAHDTVDLTTTIWDNFADAYKTTIMRMQHYYPHAKIVCITPMYNGSSKSYNKRLDSFVSVIKDITDYFGIHCIDLRKCGINLGNNPPEYGLMIDGLHPDAKGMELIANYVYLQLNNMINFGAYESTSPDTPAAVTWYIGYDVLDSILAKDISVASYGCFAYNDPTMNAKFENKQINAIKANISKPGTLTVGVVDSTNTIVDSVQVSLTNVGIQTVPLGKTLSVGSGQRPFIQKPDDTAKFAYQKTNTIDGFPQGMDAYVGVKTIQVFDNYNLNINFGYIG